MRSAILKKLITDKKERYARGVAMICDKCNKKLQYVRDVVGDPFMYCPDCCQVWVERVNK